MIINDIYKKPQGHLSIVLHKGGKYNIDTDTIDNGLVLVKRDIKNLIVENASRFMAKRMAPGQTSGYHDVNNKYVNGSNEGEYDDSGLKYLAVGHGILTKNGPYDPDPDSTFYNPIDETKWPLQNPPAEDMAYDDNDPFLKGEFFRKKFTDWRFVNPDGSISNLDGTPTNILLLVTTFDENEANGPITEMGIFGGHQASNLPDTGEMFNYKTFPVWNKPSDCKLTIKWMLTF